MCAGVCARMYAHTYVLNVCQRVGVCICNDAVCADA